jgi:hypothetical protein
MPVLAGTHPDALTFGEAGGRDRIAGSIFHQKWIIEHLCLLCPTLPCQGTYLYAPDQIEVQDLLTVVAGCVMCWYTGERCGRTRPFEQARMAAGEAACGRR